MRALASERGIVIAPQLSRATEVWALGLVVYVMLTGLEPRVDRGRTLASMMRTARACERWLSEHRLLLRRGTLGRTAAQRTALEERWIARWRTCRWLGRLAEEAEKSPDALRSMPGEKIVVLDGRPIIDGRLVPQCYLGRFAITDHEQEIYLEMLGEHAYLTAYDEKPTTTTCKSDRDCSDGRLCRAAHCGRMQGPFSVRAGEAFVLGDNRDNSHDSRSGLGGGGPAANLTGVARVVWASFGPDGPRWERTLIATDVPRAPYAADALAACLRDRAPAKVPKAR